VLEVIGLVARYGSFALDGISVTIPTGSSFAHLGPSGSGKTLFLETVIGLRHPEGGIVNIGDRNVADLPPESRGIAYLPQDLALFPHLNVFDNIAFCLHLAKMTRTAIRERVEELAEALAIGYLLKLPSVTNLSGGEKQRVALARALAGKPRYLFLDEPFSALDAARRRELYVEVRDLQRELGLTMLFVTHDLEEAQVMADRVALMRAGKLLQWGAPNEVFNSPSTRWAARFLLYENIFTATYLDEGENGLRHCAANGCPLFFSSRLPGETMRPYWFTVRAANLSLDPSRLRDPKKARSTKAVARARIQYGSEQRLKLSLGANGDGPSVVISLDHQTNKSLPESGQPTEIFYNPKDIKALEYAEEEEL